jgi:uncharacterized coiled-coil DUF342 family protein
MSEKFKEFITNYKPRFRDENGYPEYRIEDMQKAFNAGIAGLANKFEASDADEWDRHLADLNEENRSLREQLATVTEQRDNANKAWEDLTTVTEECIAQCNTIKTERDEFKESMLEWFRTSEMWRTRERDAVKTISSQKEEMGKYRMSIIELEADNAKLLNDCKMLAQWI